MFAKKNSIRMKLIAVIFFACALVIIFNISIISAVLINYLKKDFVNRTIMETKLIGEYCVTPLSFDYPERAKEILGKLGFWTNVLTGKVFDKKGKIFANYKTDKKDIGILIDPLTNVGTNYIYNKDFLHVCSEIVYKGERYGSIYIVIDSKISEKINKFLGLVFLFIFILLILTFILANNLQKIISKPILKLTNIAEKIYRRTKGNVEISYDDSDEINKLTLAFNLMVKSLENREIELEMIIENANAPVFTIDLNSKITKWNKKIEELTGYSRIEVINAKHFTDMIDTPSHPICFNMVKKALSGKNDSNIEISFITKDKKKIYILLNIAPRMDVEGNILGATIMGQDITERRQFEQDLKQERALLVQRVKERTEELVTANAQLARASRLKDEFLANMSHELRTPLSSILGLTEVLNEQIYGQLNEKQISFLKIIEDSGRHLLTLIKDILDISKIEAGSLKINITPVHIPSLCETSLRFIKQIASKKSINVNFKLHDIKQTVFADEIRLKQVLVNLLSNAVKFTHKEGNIGLEVFEDVSDSVTRFIVWDTGIGIAPENIDKLFQPFVQLDNSLSRKYEGAGLGLSLVSRFTKLHGGDVTLESELGKGSKVTVSIPWNNLSEIKNDNSKDIDIENTAFFPSSNTEISPLILVVDDVEENIITFSQYLETKGCRVITAQDGDTGIKMAVSKHPDLILMDIQMPEIDGMEAIKRIRSYDELKDVPIIALTAFAMSGDQQRCIEAGANEYLSKPVKLKQLVMTIFNLLNKKA